MLEIAYVGLDHHHRTPYLQSIEQLDAAVTCVCEPRGESTPADIAHVGDVPLYRDLDTLLAEEDVDLVWLTRSNRDTPALVESALDHDVAVFTEKPVARTAAELEPVHEAAEDATATVGVSYPWRAHPIAEELRARIDAGFFGEVDAFDARFFASTLEARDTDHYLFDRVASRGGIVQWLGVHWLDLLPWLLDDPVERANARTTHGTPGVDVEDGAVVQLETATGAVGSLTCGYSLREGRYDTRVAIYGDAGRSEWDPIGETFGFDGETTLELESRGGEWTSAPRRTITYEYEPRPGYGGAWGLEFLEETLDALANGVAPPVTLEDAHEVLRVLDAVYESASTDGWVSVEGR